MASTENQAEDTTLAVEQPNKQQAPVVSHLPTPEPSLGPDVNRNAADKERQQNASIVNPFTPEPSLPPDDNRNAAEISRSETLKASQAVKERSLDKASNGVQKSKKGDKPSIGAQVVRNLQAAEERAQERAERANKMDEKDDSNLRPVEMDQEDGALNPENPQPSIETNEGNGALTSENPQMSIKTGGDGSASPETRANIYRGIGPAIKRYFVEPSDEAESLVKQTNDALTKAGVPQEQLIHLNEIALIVSAPVRRQMQKLSRNPDNKPAQRTIEKTNERLKLLNSKYGYPDDWIIDLSRAGMVEAGLTRNGEKIMAYKLLRFGDRFYVEQQISDEHTVCKVMTKGEVGEKAAKAYLNLEGKVNLLDFKRKYYKKDADKCGDIRHVACKPAKTRKLNDNTDASDTPRMPMTDILCEFDGADTWMSWTDLTIMHGREDAMDLLEDYFDDRDLPYPWLEEPEEIVKVVKSKKKTIKNEKHDQDDGDDSDSNNKTSNERVDRLEEVVKNIQQSITSSRKEIEALTVNMDKLVSALMAQQNNQPN